MFLTANELSFFNVKLPIILSLFLPDLLQVRLSKLTCPVLTWASAVAAQIIAAAQKINLTEWIKIMDQSCKIRTQTEGRELWLPYAIEFLRKADIQEITIWDENIYGTPRVIERRLIASLKIATDAPA